jgi:hypothetical protein
MARASYGSGVLFLGCTSGEQALSRYPRCAVAGLTARPYGTDCPALKAMPRVASRRDGARTAPAKPLYSTLPRDRKRRAAILNQGDARVHLRLAIGGRHLNCDRQWGVRYLMIAFHMKYKSESL